MQLACQRRGQDRGDWPDPSVNDALVLSHLDRVHAEARVMRRRVPRAVGMDELVSAGTMGLIEASASFDPERGTVFRTHADRRIRGAMQDHLRIAGWRPRGPRRREEGLEAVLDAPSRAPGPLEAAVRLDTARAVRGLLSPLAQRTRAALVAYHAYDHSLKEIGAALGVSESRACQLVKQGLARLRRDERAADVALGGDGVA